MSVLDPASLDQSRRALAATVEKHWGYRAFRPLQQEAMHAVLAGRDSVVVMPTGGGKSLCYQAPAIVRAQSGQGPTIVVSPLISLMKDQVDSLRACGVPAAQFDSSITGEERQGIVHELREGLLHLLFVSPERLAMPAFQDFLRQVGVTAFAIDEAHCISHWGHDFRPDYRQLSQLKTLFPGCSVHAFTATATPQVRSDIAAQLALDDPHMLVGNFDRPNLTYRVLGRQDSHKQVQEIITRHPNEAGIIYCIRRREVDEMVAGMKAKGHNILAYHAGLSANDRRAAQNAFTGRGKKSCDLIAATVAFGMGIDRSDIRYIIHTGMPKSVEAYQQETGRAGRDGLEAECILLYSGADFMTWKSIIEKSAAEARSEGVELDPQFVPMALRHLQDMDDYARGAACRHKSLVEYFGQKYIAPAPPALEPNPEDPIPDSRPPIPASCNACDLCLGETEDVPDATVIAQKILSCVARVGQRFGIGQVTSVLRGENTQRSRELAHDQLSTFGLLKTHTQQELRDFVRQLIGQGLLAQSGDEYPVLVLNDASLQVMRGQRHARLIARAAKRSDKRTRIETDSWAGVDKALFEELRTLRRDLAQQRGVPFYLIFSDATLRELARIRPTSNDSLAKVYGIGQAKRQSFGAPVLALIQKFCRQNNVPADILAAPAPPPRQESTQPPMTESRRQAFALFKAGKSLAAAADALNRARSTTAQYLVEYIAHARPASIATWVNRDVYTQVANAAEKVGTDRLMPIFAHLDEGVPYEQIRFVIAHLKAQS